MTTKSFFSRFFHVLGCPWNSPTVTSQWPWEFELQHCSFLDYVWKESSTRSLRGTLGLSKGLPLYKSETMIADRNRSSSPIVSCFLFSMYFFKRLKINLPWPKFSQVRRQQRAFWLSTTWNKNLCHFRWIFNVLDRSAQTLFLLLNKLRCWSYLTSIIRVFSITPLKGLWKAKVQLLQINIAEWNYERERFQKQGRWKLVVSLNKYLFNCNWYIFFDNALWIIKKSQAKLNMYFFH